MRKNNSDDASSFFVFKLYYHYFIYLSEKTIRICDNLYVLVRLHVNCYFREEKNTFWSLWRNFNKYIFCLKVCVFFQ